MESRFRSKVQKIAAITAEECDRYFLNEKTPLQLPAKAFFLNQNDMCTQMAFVEKGTLRMYYISPEGKEINVEFFFEDDFVTEYQSFLQQSPSKYFIEALTDCELTAISYSAIQMAYKNSFAWQEFGRIVAEKSFTRAQQRTESFLFYSAEERYLNLLKRRPYIFEKIPLYHIASYLGIERESLSRLRKKLSKERL
jgi:CRP/FNR family transcriptional regulator, anaerobic regulatory protein